MELDNKDKILYEYLFYDARRSTRDLARMMKMKQPSVHARIKKLEKEGFINRYDSLLTTDAIPLMYKMYYASLNKEQVHDLLKMPQCYGLQETFGEFTHQIFAFFKNNKQIKEFENKLPKRRISHLLTKTYRLGGSIFDIKRAEEKYPEYTKKLKLDKIDIKLMHSMIIGGARKTIMELANELHTTAPIVKYRKKRLIQHGYFLFFVAQPGEAFKSLKIAYHVFKLNNNFDINIIKGLPRCVAAYVGYKTVTVIQLSLTLDDYLIHSNSLIRKLEPYTNKLRTFFINKPIILNRFPEELLVPLCRGP